MSELKPGRELDALVAEKVMGFVVHRNKRGGWSLGEPDYYDDHGATTLVNPLPAYSEDIAAAWEVLSKFENFEISSFIKGEPKFYGVELLRDGEWIRGPGETAPHAICLAALRAVGYEP